MKQFHVLITRLFHKMHGDETSVSQTSVCRVIKEVTEAIARKKREFMTLPTTREEVETGDVWAID